jgi:hypothetical protein
MRQPSLETFLRRQARGKRKAGDWEGLSRQAKLMTHHALGKNLYGVFSSIPDAVFLEAWTGSIIECNEKA